jgi:hypothetical protein
MIFRFSAFTNSDDLTATWDRKFDGKLFRSKMELRSGRLIEKFGIFSYVIHMHVDSQKNSIFYRSVDCSVLGVKIPKVCGILEGVPETGGEGWKGMERERSRKQRNGADSRKERIGMERSEKGRRGAGRDGEGGRSGRGGKGNWKGGKGEGGTGGGRKVGKDGKDGTGGTSSGKYRAERQKTSWKMI